MKQYQAKLPLLLTYMGALFFTFLALFTIYNLETMSERVFAILMLVVYVLWMKWESHVSKNELKKDYSSYDGGTMEFAAFSKMTTLTLAFVFTTKISFPLAFFGALLMLFGMGIRVRAIIELGERYSHRIRPIQNGIKMDGIYGVIRHPAYLGTFFIHLGFVLIFLSLYSLLSCIFLWGLAVLIRVKKEEELLQQNLDYRNYSKMVRGRLIPFLF